MTSHRPDSSKVTSSQGKHDNFHDNRNWLGSFKAATPEAAAPEMSLVLSSALSLLQARNARKAFQFLVSSLKRAALPGSSRENVMKTEGGGHLQISWVVQLDRPPAQA